jgi:acetyl esterase/lipase
MPRTWTGTAIRAVRGLVLLAAATLLFLAFWVVVPAPTLFLLPFGVAAPELSPVLCALSVVVAGIALAGMFGRPGWVACGLAASAALLSAIPLAQLPGALDRFDGAMAAARLAGDTVQERRPGSRDADFRPRAFSLRDLVFGIDRGTSTVRRAVPFSAPGATPLAADIYFTERALGAARRSPVLMQIYGGAWQRGRAGDDEAFARYFAARGYVVVAIDYRHAPAALWPAQIEDVRAALAWVRTHAHEYGGDPGALALIGRSAGAQLALVAAYEAGVPEVAGVVSFYGPVYLAEGWRVPPRPDPLGVRAVLETYLGGTPAQVPDRYRAASPAGLVTSSTPPTLLIYGTRDHIVEARFARQLDAQLRAAGVPSVLLELPWAEHAFDALPDGLSAQVALFFTERFLARLFVG